jgi:hypothetical protein
MSTYRAFAYRLASFARMTLQNVMIRFGFTSRMTTVIGSRIPQAFARLPVPQPAATTTRGGFIARQV